MERNAAVGIVPFGEEEESVLQKELHKQFTTMIAEPRVQEGLAFLKNDDRQTLHEQMTIAEIPAPPFQEEKRANYVQEQFRKLGLTNVKQDEEGNVYGLRPGKKDVSAIVVSAHLDSVFSEETDVTVKERDGVYYGPGITDDARGLAALLSVIRAFQHTGIQTEAPIVFLATVGEEGPGDLRGVKAFIDGNANIASFISIDSVSPEEIIYQGTGSFRYEVTFSGTGGHSFQHFGTPSAVHAAGRAIAAIASLDVPETPKTTFNVGVVEGGTIPTAIAETCTIKLDLRSNGRAELDSIAEKALLLCETACSQEGEGDQTIRLSSKKVGDRPVGVQSADSEIVEMAVLATEALGLTPELAPPSSTDANYPISKGIPALTLGGGGEGGGYHSLNEWYKPVNSYLGPQRVWLVALGLARAIPGSQNS